MNNLSAYNNLFQEIINTINTARYQAYKSLNKFHIGQNFEIGRIIVENQEKYKWGQAVVDNLSKDINKQINGIKGYSAQNLWRMRQFHLEYKDTPELLELALKIPWGQNMLIIHQLKNYEERKYYLKATNQLGWSRAILLNQIKGDAYKHQLTDKKLNNFDKALPVHLSEQANEALKCEYCLENANNSYK